MAEDPQSIPVTELLQAWRLGDDSAFHRLLPLVHKDLRLLASRRVRSLAPGDSMQATALVNEAYLRLVHAGQVEFRDRSHFFAICATVMRQVLIEQARFRNRDKRGGDWRRITFNGADFPAPGSEDSLLGIDQALNRLAVMDHRKARVVELRFFAGMTNPEIAEVMHISVDTVKRDWSFAKLWLANELRSTFAQ